MDLVQANWPLVVIAALAALLLLWWLFVSLRRTKVITDTSDVLDEGKGPASRNQALIDAPPVAVKADALSRETAPITATTANEIKSSDDLTRIKGVGPKLQTLLNELGVNSFTQIAEWGDADIDKIDAQLGRFEGRIRRDSWTDQAKLLAAGDTAGYEDKFGKL